MKNDSRSLLLAILIVVIAIFAYVMLTTREHRTVGEKVNDAVKELQDRTPAEKMKDKIDNSNGT